MTKKKAEQLAALGVDRIQVSLDGLDAESHDAFRRKPGAYVKALQAMKYIKAAGMGLQIGSVLTHERIATGEMERFLTFTDTLGGKVSLTFPFLLGEWEGRSDLLLTDKDMAIMREMETRHNVATHLSSKYGNPGECMAVKRMVIISPWGDVNPCAGIRRDLGNILDEPLADILQRAMRVYGKPCRVCRVGMLPSMTVEDMA
jgi:MoaA/NifB/PqqE/SkfB family radical SAM enzyme